MRGFHLKIDAKHPAKVTIIQPLKQGMAIAAVSARIAKRTAPGFDDVVSGRFPATMVDKII
jgi:hypothetical protein